MSEPVTGRQVANLFLRQRVPSGRGPHPVLLLLHGWTGDEHSMSIFIPALPPEALLIIPRGLYPTPLGGYSWQPDHEKKWASLQDFQPAVEALMDLLDPVTFPTADLDRLSLVGFSQGAALVYSFALIYPQRVRAFAALAGFMPEGAAEYIQAEHPPLRGKPVFVSHGQRDEMVPIQRARTAVALLEQTGALVTYCESNAGHKLSLDCFEGLGEFFKTNY